jgi:hypothetical protein
MDSQVNSMERDKLYSISGIFIIFLGLLFLMRINNYELFVIISIISTFITIIIFIIIFILTQSLINSIINAEISVISGSTAIIPLFIFESNLNIISIIATILILISSTAIMCPLKSTLFNKTPYLFNIILTSFLLIIGLVSFDVVRISPLI